MDSRTYAPVTRQQANDFLDEAAKAGLQVSKKDESDGSVSGFDTQVDYRYDEAAQRLTLTVMKHPPFMEGVVWHQVESRLPAGVSRV